MSTNPVIASHSSEAQRQEIGRAEPAYRRVLLKLSGEALMGDDSYGINRATIEHMAKGIAEIAAMGVEIAIVIGGIGCRSGLKTQVGPGAVGASTTRAVVAGIVAIIVLDGVLVALFHALGI